MVVTVTETCSNLYIIEYIVFLLNDFLISTTTQDGSYQIAYSKPTDTHTHTYIYISVFFLNLANLSLHICMVTHKQKCLFQQEAVPVLYSLYVGACNCNECALRQEWRSEGYLAPKSGKKKWKIVTDFG
jgi:hypothetical protein